MLLSTKNMDFKFLPSVALIRCLSIRVIWTK